MKTVKKYGWRGYIAFIPTIVLFFAMWICCILFELLDAFVIWRKVKLSSAFKRTILCILARTDG